MGSRLSKDDEEWKNTPCIESTSVTQSRRELNRIMGKPPAPLMYCHHCDNTVCINPLHVFWGTNSDNMQDCSKKGRISRGVDRPLHRLTPELVLEIRKDQSISAGKWALRLKVSKRTILMVRGGVTWKHV